MKCNYHPNKARLTKSAQRKLMPVVMAAMAKVNPELLTDAVSTVVGIGRNIDLQRRNDNE